MSLTRNDKTVMAVAVVMAAAIVGGLAWWRTSDRPKDTEVMAAGPEFVRVETQPRQPPQTGMQTLSSDPGDAGNQTSVNSAPEPSQTPDTAKPQSEEPQTQPSGQEIPQTAKDESSLQAVLPGQDVSRAVKPQSEEPQPQEPQVQPSGQEIPQAAQAESLSQAGALETPEAPLGIGPLDEPSNAPAQEAQEASALSAKAIGKKSGVSGRYSRELTHSGARRTVEGVLVTETAGELVFTLKGTAGAAKPNVMVLSSPPRLVADLEGGNWVYRGNGQPHSAYVAGIRTGTTSQRLRIVADLVGMPDRGRPIVGTSPEGITIRINKPVKK